MRDHGIDPSGMNDANVTKLAESLTSNYLYVAAAEALSDADSGSQDDRLWDEFSEMYSGGDLATPFAEPGFVGKPQWPSQPGSDVRPAPAVEPRAPAAAPQSALPAEPELAPAQPQLAPASAMHLPLPCTRFYTSSQPPASAMHPQASALAVEAVPAPTSPGLPPALVSQLLGAPSLADALVMIQSAASKCADVAAHVAARAEPVPDVAVAQQLYESLNGAPFRKPENTELDADFAAHLAASEVPAADADSRKQFA